MKIGIFGATGAVGEEILNVLRDRKFPVSELRLYGNSTAGETRETPFGELLVEKGSEADCSSLDLIFCSVGDGWEKENIPKILEAGCYVIDNSSTFRYDDNIPLVIPEINPDAIGDSRLIANPNCTTAIAAIPLYQIKKRWGLERIIISTYQAASGAGKEAMDELKEQAEQYPNIKPREKSKFAYQLLMNALPFIDTLQQNGYSREEMKVYWELNKIFGIEKGKEIPVSCTAVRIPALRAHSESISSQTIYRSNPDEFREILRSTPGVEVVDAPAENIYPMQLTATEKYNVEVGRIRQSIAFGANGLDFYVCGDQLLKGAALNAVQIAELIAEKIQPTL